MNFSAVGGITLAAVAGLWIFVFIPSWFNSASERNQEKTQVREVKSAVAKARQPILKAPKTKVSSLSEQVFRVCRTIRVVDFLTWMFACTAVALGFAVSKFGFLLPFVIVSAVLAAVFLRAGFMARTARNRLLVGSIRSRGESAAMARATTVKAHAETLAQVRAAEIAHQQAAQKAREWAAEREAARLAREFRVEPIPAPTYAAQVGSLETPVFAKVLDLGEKAAEIASAQAVEATADKLGQAKAQAVGQTSPLDSSTIDEILRRRRASNS